MKNPGESVEAVLTAPRLMLATLEDSVCRVVTITNVATEREREIACQGWTNKILIEQAKQLPASPGGMAEEGPRNKCQGSEAYRGQDRLG